MARRFALAVALMLLAAAGGRTQPAVAGTAAAHLSLRSASGSVVLYRYGRHHHVRLDLGMFLQDLGGDFRLDVTRTYGGPIHVAMQTPSGWRQLPDSVANGWLGLQSMFRYTVRDETGAVIRERDTNFCPNTYARQRVDASGPLTAAYPQFCFANPFSLGAVWGIDHGWATPLEQTPAVRLPLGSYRITVRVLHRYTELLGIPPEQAVATVTATVKDVGRNGCPPYCATASDRAAPSESPAAAPTDLAPDPATEPDLIPLPAWSIGTAHLNHRDVIVFGATVWDAGPAPMVVEGYRRPNSDIMDAYEYFFRNGQPVGRAPAGTMKYDARPGHQHWHFEQFARYTLLSADRQEVVRSRKQAFCLAPTDPIDLTVRNALWNPFSIGLEGACGDQNAIWTRETLPVGWGDTYFQFRPGQSFNISDLPNGTYWIKVQANPEGLLHEANRGNDVSFRKVILTGTPGHRRADVPPWHGIDA
jgi:Lysyl oxidase